MFRFWLCLWLSLWASAALASDDVALGRRIYMEGILPSGAQLKGKREDIEFSGQQAACATCHRPSGMGSVEGDIQVPPITGNYLYQTGDRLFVTMDPRSGKRFNNSHAPYTDAALGKAIRQGINIGGQEMNVLMPRYQLNDNELSALTAYLKQLSRQYSPGVTQDEVHLATVVTPDADPEKRRILLNILEKGVLQKNGSTMLNGNRVGRRHMVTAAELVLGTERKWVWHTWSLQGKPDTWPEQLERFYQQEPVFALVSGLGGSTWKPVQDFCEQNHVPCWFPSVDAPGNSEASVYSMYFQRGTVLEADVLSKYFVDMPEQAPARLVQIYRDETGKMAALKMAESFKNSPTKVENRTLPNTSLNELRKALDGLGEHDAVMLWLNASDLSAVNALPIPKVPIYVSGRMAGGENAPLTGTWKTAANMVYPYELPDRRQVNLNYFHHWMRVNQIPIENELLQAEAYFALDLFSETMTEMLDNVYRDYLLERAESMLSRNETGKLEQRERVQQVMRWSTRVPRTKKSPTQDKPASNTESTTQTEQAPKETTFVTGKSTTIYPRMSLGIGQRFASKGAYIVRFTDANKNNLSPVSGWIVP